MKIKNIGFVIIVLLFLYILTWFVYTRFCLDIYEMDGLILTNQKNVYVYKNSLPENNGKNIGKPIGIAFQGKRTWMNTVFPYWIREYNNDTEHNVVFVRGLMDEGGVYEKVSK